MLSRVARNTKLSQVGLEPAAIWGMWLEHDLATLAAAQAQVGGLQSHTPQADAAIAREQQATLRKPSSICPIADLRRGAGAWPTRPCGSVTSYSRLGRCYRFSAVPNETYIIANFKETQIAYVRVGQSVSVRVDALPGEKLRGDIQLPNREGFELRSAA
jgi:membrane fusion protein, multidrug efflux system